MDFVEFPKIARLSREIIITEKIDGTNASITIEEDGTFRAASRTRWITTSDDNHGFAQWAHENREELLKLGVGSHFGEWWGRGIQRNYSLQEKRFSLFNTTRWEDNPERPTCCHVVPVLYRGEFTQSGWIEALAMLKKNGSYAAPGFMNPEGIVLFHTAANFCFKKTLVKDEMSKQQAEKQAAAA